MKDIVKQAKCLLIADFPLQAAYITAQFASTQQRYQSETPEWSTNATRQKLISEYWLAYVPAHFSLIVGLPFLIVFVAQTMLQSEFYVLSILIASLPSYAILYVFLYRPSFSAVFLPRLETVKEAYERKQEERLQKYRQAQLSNFALTLFFYVMVLTNDLDSIKCDDNSANLLTKLFGVVLSSLKKNLKLIMTTSKRKNLSERKITEIRNRFNETYSFLEELDCVKGIKKLKELEAKFFN